MQLHGKVAVITGSSANIGRAIALRLSQLGCTIVVNSRSNVEGGKSVVAEIVGQGRQALYVQADVSDPDQADMLFARTLERFGTVDIMINNAGASRPTSFLESSKDHWIEVFNVNFFSAVLCAQRAARIMLEADGGTIINTSSVRGMNHAGREGIMAYSSAKAAINNFTKTLAKQLAPSITVNAVAPGFVYTSHYESVPNDVKDEFIDSTLIKRWIYADELAEAYVYLAQSDAVTGQILVVDGGFTLK
jgi:3-oxoacyl-[acyl-carrier protein] reductase